VDGVGTAERVALARANREYERRFGYRFLIFASGRSGADLLAAARVRLRNDPATERQVVQDELGKITRLRLERMLG
jgi:2-oxo-4-hydroxy-4-carboxy-5-ureidoimidazoline decarboxylase